MEMSNVRFIFSLFILQPTLPSTGRQAPRTGNLGHITRISNKLVQLGNTDSRIQMHLQVCSICHTCVDMTERLTREALLFFLDDSNIIFTCV